MAATSNIDISARRPTATRRAILSALAAVMLVVAVSAQRIRADSIRVVDRASGTLLRSKICELIWGTDSVPTDATIGAIELDVQFPGLYKNFPYDPLRIPSGPLRRLDRFTVSLPFGLKSVIYRFIPAVPNGRLMIYHSGHVEDTTGSAFQFEDMGANGDGIEPGLVIPRLLTAGYEVLALMMPLRGNNQPWIPSSDPTVHLIHHGQLFDNFDHPYALFLTPLSRMLNYLKVDSAYTGVYMMGLSGGGWTTTLYSALDPRIRGSFPVAGDIPLPWRDSPDDWGDEEQWFGPLYGIAGYSDFHILGSFDAGRFQMQVLNEYDASCFRGHSFEEWYEPIRRRVDDLSGSYRLYIDRSHNAHKISNQALERILAAIDQPLPRLELSLPSILKAGKAVSGKVYWRSGDSVSYPGTALTALSVPSWLTLDTLTGELLGIPKGSETDTVIAIGALTPSGVIDMRVSRVSVVRNSLPALATPPVLVALEDSLFQMDIHCVDADSALGDRPVLLIQFLPAWLTLDTARLRLVGVPRSTDVGLGPVRFTWNDGDGGIFRFIDSVNVKHTNHPPVVVRHPVVQVEEDAPLQLQLPMLDSDTELFGDILHARALVPFRWASLDTVLGVVSGIPTVMDFADTVGYYEIVDVNGAATICTVTVQIVHRNHPPQLHAINQLIAQEDSAYMHQVGAIDVDSVWGDRLVHFVEEGPQWLSVDSVTGMLRGIPYGSDVGRSQLVMGVHDDSGAIDYVTAVLIVQHTNHQPVVQRLPAPVAVEDKEYRSAIETIDKDTKLFGDELHYRLITAHKWLSLDSTTGELWGVPTIRQLGDTVVALSVRDSRGGTTDTVFTIRVQHINHVPSVTSSPDTTAQEDSLYEYEVIMADADTSLGDSLTANLIEGPKWLTWDSQLRSAIGVPRREDVGVARATVRIEDAQGAVIVQQWDISVAHTNHPPILVGDPDTIAFEGVPYSWNVRAVDGDSALFGDLITYRLIGPPLWMSIDSITGSIQGRPTSTDVGASIVTITARDQSGMEARRTFSLTIMHVNHPVTILSSPPIRAAEDSLYEYRMVAVDPDTLLWGDEIRYRILLAPSWIEIDTMTGMVFGIPRGNDVGEATIALFVRDATDGGSRQEYQLKIVHTNHSPTIKMLPDSNATEDVCYSSSIVAFDRDTEIFGDSVSYSLVEAPPWLAIDRRTGVITGIPNGSDVGESSVTIRVCDTYGLSTMASLVLKVAPTNHPPAVVSYPDTTVMEDSSYVYLLKVADPDLFYSRDSLHLIVHDMPRWLSCDSTTWRISGIPRWSNVGRDTVRLSVVDAGMLVAGLTWTIDVTPTRHPPTASRGVSPSDMLIVQLVSPFATIPFRWTPSVDADIEDTVQYIIRLTGPDLDTTITIIGDTTADFKIRNPLVIGGDYSWCVDVADGYFLTAGDTRGFRVALVTEVDKGCSNLPQEYALHQNYPNPFNPASIIQYDVPVTSNVRLAVFNILGQKVTTICDGIYQAGVYRANWNAWSYSSGIYLAQMIAYPVHNPNEVYRKVVRMVLAR